MPRLSVMRPLCADRNQTVDYKLWFGLIDPAQVVVRRDGLERRIKRLERLQIGHRLNVGQQRQPIITKLEFEPLGDRRQ